MSCHKHDKATARNISSKSYAMLSSGMSGRVVLAVCDNYSDRSTGNTRHIQAYYPNMKGR